MPERACANPQLAHTIQADPALLTSEMLLKLADKRLYAANENGRNSTVADRDFSSKAALAAQEDS